MLGWMCCGTIDQEEQQIDSERQPLFQRRANELPSPSHRLTLHPSLSRGTTPLPHQLKLDPKKGHPSLGQFHSLSDPSLHDSRTDGEVTSGHDHDMPQSALVHHGKRAGKQQTDERGRAQTMRRGLQVSPSRPFHLSFQLQQHQLPNLHEDQPNSFSQVRRYRYGQALGQGYRDGLSDSTVPRTMPNTPSFAVRTFASLSSDDLTQPGERDRKVATVTARPEAVVEEHRTGGDQIQTGNTSPKLGHGLGESISGLGRKLITSPPLAGRDRSQPSFPRPLTTHSALPSASTAHRFPASPPSFGRSVSEPQHLNLHRRLSSSLAQYQQHHRQWSDPKDATERKPKESTSIRPAELEGFAAHMLPQGLNTDRRSVMVVRGRGGRPRSSTLVSITTSRRSNSGGTKTNSGTADGNSLSAGNLSNQDGRDWMVVAAESSYVGGAHVGVARDRERGESIHRAAEDRSDRTTRTNSAVSLNLGMSRALSDEGPRIRQGSSRTRQRDGSVGKGYPGVAGQSRRGRSPGPSRLGSRNVSSESLWRFDADGPAILAANSVAPVLPASGPVSACESFNTAHPSNRARHDSHQVRSAVRPRPSPLQAPIAVTEQNVGAGEGPISPGLQMPESFEKGKGVRSVRSMGTGVGTEGTALSTLRQIKSTDALGSKAR